MGHKQSDHLKQRFEAGLVLHASLASRASRGLRASPHPHLVHMFRVELKRFESLCWVLEKCSDGPCHFHAWRVLSRATRHAWSLSRELYILGKLLERVRREEDIPLRQALFSTSQSSQAERALLESQPLLHKLLDSMRKAVRQASLHDSLLHASIKNGVRILLGEGREALERVCGGAPTPEDYHRLRIRLKRIRYVGGTIDPERLRSGLFSSPDLKAFSDALGDLHDLDESLRVLSLSESEDAKEEALQVQVFGHDRAKLLASLQGRRERLEFSCLGQARHLLQEFAER